MRVVSEEARVRDDDVEAGSGGSWFVVDVSEPRISRENSVAPSPHTNSFRS